MKRYKIEYKKNDCVGAGECSALSPEFWALENNGKASLKGAVFNEATKKYELFIDEEFLKKQKTAASACPVGCIKIVEA